MAQIAHVDGMTGYAHKGKKNREAVDEGEEALDGDDTVDKATQELTSENSVFFHQFGKIVESACC